MASSEDPEMQAMRAQLQLLTSIASTLHSRLLLLARARIPANAHISTDLCDQVHPYRPATPWGMETPSLKHAETANSGNNGTFSLCSPLHIMTGTTFCEVWRTAEVDVQTQGRDPEPKALPPPF